MSIRKHKSNYYLAFILIASFAMTLSTPFKALAKATTKKVRTVTSINDLRPGKIIEIENDIILVKWTSSSIPRVGTKVFISDKFSNNLLAKANVLESMPKGRYNVLICDIEKRYSDKRYLKPESAVYREKDVKLNAHVFRKFRKKMYSSSNPKLLSNNGILSTKNVSRPRLNSYLKNTLYSEINMKNGTTKTGIDQNHIEIRLSYLNKINDYLGIGLNGLLSSSLNLTSSKNDSLANENSISALVPIEVFNITNLSTSYFYGNEKHSNAADNLDSLLSYRGISTGIKLKGPFGSTLSLSNSVSLNIKHDTQENPQLIKFSTQELKLSKPISLGAFNQFTWLLGLELNSFNYKNSVNLSTSKSNSESISIGISAWLL